MLVSLVAGCGREPSGTVSGSVTHNGQPVVLGFIAFHSETGRTASAGITGGRYVADKVPLGPAKLTVQALPQVTPRNAQKINQFVPLPARYHDKTTSDLTYDVKDGEQTHDVALAGD